MAGRDKADEKVILRRSMGLPTATCLVIGTIIGQGIFVSPTAVIRQTQSVGASLLVWFACGIYSILVAWSEVELGTMFKQCGGNYVYIRTALSPFISYFVIWSSLLSNSALLASKSMLGSSYLLAVIMADGCETPWILEKTLAAVLIFAIYFINIYGFKSANWVQSVCTIGKVLALVVIIVGGMYRLATGHIGNFQNSFIGTSTNPGQIAIAFYSGVGAYGGSGSILRVTEEINNPRKVIPRAIFASLAIVIGIYCLTNVSYFTVMDAEAMKASPTVATTWAETVIPNFVWFISLSVVVSTFGSAISNSLQGSRLMFTSSRGGELPLIFSMIHTDWRTPLPAMIYGICVSITAVFLTDIWTLIYALGFLYMIFVSLTNISLLVLRKTRPDMLRPIKVPVVVPVFIIIMSFTLFTMSIVMSTDRLLFVYALAYILAALPVYFIFVFKEFSIPGTTWLTARLQVAMNVVPTEDEFTQVHNQKILHADKNNHNSRYHSTDGKISINPENAGLKQETHF